MPSIWSTKAWKSRSTCEPRPRRGQSRVGWLRSPQMAQRTPAFAKEMRCLFGHSNCRWPFSPQRWQCSSPLRVPLMSASSRSWRCLCSFRSSSSGTMISRTIFAARSTMSWSSPVMSTCRSSSMSFSVAAERVRLPSFTEPLPRIAILQPVSRSSRFCVLPRGPMISPMKLYCGNSSTGMYTFFVTFAPAPPTAANSGFSLPISAMTRCRSSSSACRMRTSRVFTRTPLPSYTGFGDGGRSGWSTGSASMRCASDATFWIDPFSCRSRSCSTCSSGCASDASCAAVASPHRLRRRRCTGGAASAAGASPSELHRLRLRRGMAAASDMARAPRAAGRRGRGGPRRRVEGGLLGPPRRAAGRRSFVRLSLAHGPAARRRRHPPYLLHIPKSSLPPLDNSIFSGSRTGWRSG